MRVLMMNLATKPLLLMVKVLQTIHGNSDTYPRKCMRLQARKSDEIGGTAKASSGKQTKYKQAFIPLALCVAGHQLPSNSSFQAASSRQPKQVQIEQVAWQSLIWF